MKNARSKPLISGDVMIITGASSDIGYRMTQRFAELGMKIMAHYSNNAVQLEKLSSPSIQLYKADLRQEGLAKELVHETIKRFGRVNTLINTVGPFQEQELLAVSTADWRDMIELNLNVAFSMSHYASPYLIETKGQILNFAYAGVENITAWTAATAYAAAKAGLAVLTKSLATALGPKAVRVNAISPGWIDFGKFSETVTKGLEEKIPLGRLGNPIEVIDMAQWMLMNSPEYMTGALIPLAGGLEF
jgi:NAD(P)-dependent dehydrogenase (short-subunit alcohol dehydrogenase family)